MEKQLNNKSIPTNQPTEKIVSSANLFSRLTPEVQILIIDSIKSLLSEKQ